MSRDIFCPFIELFLDRKMYFSTLKAIKNVVFLKKIKMSRHSGGMGPC